MGDGRASRQFAGKPAEHKPLASVHIITIMAFNLHTSNRLDLLAGQLAAVMGEPLPSVLALEIIVAQSRGIERWLSLWLART